MAGVEIELDRVCRRYRSGGSTIAAVDDVSARFTAGTMTAVVGASGSGKSTLLHLIGGVDVPDSGAVLVGGQDITALRQKELVRYRRTVGFVFQQYHLLPVLTALDNVLAPVMPYRTTFNKVARARELLDAVGLADRERSLPSQLSGGQQQRVAIARALINEPALLLADEPTGNLDSSAGTDVLDLLVRLQSGRGMTVLIATHEQHVAARCDRLLRLRDGRVIDDLEVPRPADAGADTESTLARAPELRP
ncbi:ABC transporter ATP-binding protein [Micromonospora profundi]|uniref:ABC transporter ATP-binding protein n=1 Tax=Micromonospora TaxID=1873 RepID=UPI00339FB8E9